MSRPPGQTRVARSLSGLSQRGEIQSSVRPTSQVGRHKTPPASTSSTAANSNQRASVPGTWPSMARTSAAGSPSRTTAALVAVLVAVVVGLLVGPE